MKVRTEARREAILEVASQVFLEFGFERASMAEIVHRIGGSKSTIYGYYPSKEALFLAVTKAAGELHIESAFDELAAHDIRAGVLEVLGKFSEKLAVLMCSPELAATHRMVLAEAGRSNVGALFYEAGPQRGILDIAEFFRRAMAQGCMRQGDPTVAAQQFIALVQAEIQPRWYYKELPPLTDAQIKDIAGRAMVTFANAYALAPDSAMAEAVSCQ
ncbi:TetR/AcrR family transcriptional regulator [Rhodoferax sp. U11-2br]|uniref:TetR/AcrR family transcriptional regulator n=1 Tax=Rhodoferax sp. U11-2br TaxID=2838878 RepID=UPI001BEBE8D7|nr:TetR/AcrR family transcriptional regulator [Rhodoferax sp. U11-2br]MBT3067076.1 TetR/AcrR family transcriptional regulator [Rhodoferax sp. U11-2br]